MADDDFDVAGVWRSFCARLGAAGDRLARAPFPTSGADRALGVRHLTRQLVMALQARARVRRRRITGVSSLRRTVGAMGRTESRQRLHARPRSIPAATYRVFGNVAGVRAALFSLVDGDMHLGQYGVFSERALADLDVAPDGSLRAVDLARSARAQLDRVACRRAPVPRAAVPLRLGARPGRDR